MSLSFLVMGKLCLALRDRHFVTENQIFISPFPSELSAVENFEDKTSGVLGAQWPSGTAGRTW